MSGIIKRLTDRKWWSAASSRLIYTFFECLAGILVMSAGMGRLDWSMALAAAALSAVVSLGKSAVVGVPETKEGQA